MDSDCIKGSNGGIDQAMRVVERAAPVAAVVSALGTLACCLPWGIAGAVGALGLSAALTKLQPWLIGLALLLLGVGVFQLYRKRTCQRRSRLSMILLAASAAIVLAVVAFPQVVAGLMADLP
jgi:hypothetical protein